MRILHVIPHYWPAVRYGGPIRSVHGLARATAALGHEVHVYTTNVDGAGVSDVPVGRAVARDGMQVTYFETGAGRGVYRSPQMERAFAETIAGFDIVHIHYVWVWTTVAAARAAWAAGVPYVLSPRGMLVAELIARKSPLAKRVWLALFDRKNVERAAAIHVTAGSEGEQLRELGLKTRRVAVIANGIDPEEAGQPTHGAGAADGPPLILFLGRISWKKGLDRLIAALPEVQGAELVIAGYDEGGYQAEAERLAREAGVMDRVRFVGGVEGAAKWALIGQARCLVLASYNENFGMAVVEAMAAGCAVVVTPEVGLASVVMESGSGIVTAGEPKPLAAAINRVIGDASLRARMGEAGRRTVRARFGWEGIAREMVALYDECASGAR